MTVPIFKSFFPSVQRWINTAFRSEYKLIIHNATGAPVGITSQNGNGPQGIWAPTPLSAAQIAAPTPEMLADLNATFQLNVAPYSRFYSDGTQLIPVGAEGGTVIPPGRSDLFFSPLVITEGNPLRIEGSARVIQA